MTWPVTLTWGDIRLRPLRRSDSHQWHAIRRTNAGWLKQWEATLPSADPAVPGTFAGMVRSFRREARAGRALAFALDVDGRLAGQVTLGGIAWGSLRSAYIGYWIAQQAAGRGSMPRAVALVTDHAFAAMGLHRIEINIRPENQASLRVVEKLGYRREGYRERYLHIDGAWRDHVSFAMLSDEWPTGGLVADIQRNGWRDQRSATRMDGEAFRMNRHNRDTPEESERGRTVRDTGGSLPRFAPRHP